MEEHNLFNKYKLDLYINTRQTSNKPKKINKNINLKENLIFYQFNYGTPVFLNIYHITKINLILEYLSLSSYHTTIQIHSYEFSYGESQIPNQTGINIIYKNEKDGLNESIFHLKSRIFLGFTLYSQLEINNIVDMMGKMWTGISYCPFSKNCNDFTKDLAERILLEKINFPKYINRFKGLGCCFYIFFRPLQAYSEMKKKKNLKSNISFSYEEHDSYDKNKNEVRINKSSLLYLKDNSNIRITKFHNQIKKEDEKIKGQEKNEGDEELLLRIIMIIQDFIENLDKIREEKKENEKVKFLISHFRKTNDRLKEIKGMLNVNNSISHSLNRMSRVNSNIDNIDYIDNSNLNSNNNIKLSSNNVNNLLPDIKPYIIKVIIKEIYEFILKFYELNILSHTTQTNPTYNNKETGIIKEYSFTINEFLYIIHDEIFNIIFDVNELIRIKELFTEITRILYLILNEIHSLS